MAGRAFTLDGRGRRGKGWMGLSKWLQFLMFALLHPCPPSMSSGCPPLGVLLWVVASGWFPLMETLGGVLLSVVSSSGWGPPCSALKFCSSSQAQPFWLEIGPGHGSDERHWSTAQKPRPLGYITGNPDSSGPAAERRDPDRGQPLRTPAQHHRLHQGEPTGEWNTLNIDLTQSDVTQSDVTQSDVTQSDVTQ